MFDFNVCVEGYLCWFVGILFLIKKRNYCYPFCRTILSIKVIMDPRSSELHSKNIMLYHLSEDVLDYTSIVYKKEFLTELTKYGNIS